MKYTLTVLLIILSSSLFAQDFTSSISKMAFKNGEIFGNLKRCNAPAESLIIYEKIIQQLKIDKLPNNSYIKLYDQFYAEGEESVLSKLDSEQTDCEEHLENAKELLLFDEKNS